jgi:hypothetical protein
MFAIWKLSGIILKVSDDVRLVLLDFWTLYIVQYFEYNTTLDEMMKNTYSVRSLKISYSHLFLSISPQD